MTKKILIGKINSVFGIKGEVKIISYCQNPTDIEKYPLFDKNDVALTLKITNKNKAVVGTTSDGGAILIAKISLADDRNAAEKLRGLEIFTDRKNFSTKLKKDEFYQEDLVGLNVVDDAGKVLGKVLAVLDFGGGVMLEIEFNAIKDLEKIENFPFKNEFFPEIDVEKGFVRINLPEEVIEIK